MVSLVQLRGRLVVLNVYAGNCPPCREEMPDLEAAYQQYRDRVVLIGVDIGSFTGLGMREEGKQPFGDEESYEERKAA
ncbi:MAG: TlpA family protein disulfide reductase [Dehalococcoidia bacterium]|nr:TlpA family protein disulfide reductase [Dehalococcoidia bacterium]